MRRGVLRGRDHAHLGEVAALAEGRAAAALSRGGARKPYAHKDPNEDAAGFASGEGGVLVAVADAHHGHEAAEIALRELFRGFAPSWTDASPPARPWAELTVEAIARLHAAVVAGNGRHPSSESRTTLAFALVRPDQDRLAWASLGDSHVFRVGSAGAEELGGGKEDFSYFLGSARRTAGELAERLRSGEGPLGDERAVVLVTDGLSEPKIGAADPAAAVAEAVAAAGRAASGLRALTAARGLVELALDAHRHNRAGDNVAAAVYYAA